MPVPFGGDSQLLVFPDDLQFIGGVGSEGAVPREHGDGGQGWYGAGGSRGG